jgi:cytoskeletal protein RodZ
VQRSTIGVGPVLRKARRVRGVSIAEASRDTKIRRDLIQALEDEDFDRLLGDVYVRGALRSYATYLGLPADRVLSRYASSAGEAEPSSAAPPPSTDAVVGAPRRRDDHVLVATIAAILVVLAIAFGVLSPRESAPAPAGAAAEPPSQVAAPGISLSVSTDTEPVDVTIRQDDRPSTSFHLLPGESRSFVADRSLTVRLSKGATADVVVAGKDLGTPGRADRPWRHTFSYETPTAAASAGA